MKILKMSALAVAMLCSTSLFSSLKAQTIDLLNGKDLSNWTFVVDDKSVKAEDVYSMKNGVLHIKGSPFGFMATKDTYENYRLHVEWMWPVEGSNSGIFLYLQPDERTFPNTVECQLHSGDAGDFVIMGGAYVKELNLAPGQEQPAFGNVKKRQASSEFPIGQWNSADITCEDGKVTVFINGVLQNIGTESKHKTGHVGLQSEGKDILFRNVRLTPLPLK